MLTALLNHNVQDPSRGEEVVEAAESGLVICVTDAESQIGEQIALQLIQDRWEEGLYGFLSMVNHTEDKMQTTVHD